MSQQLKLNLLFMDPLAKVLKKLPKTFTRKQWLDAVSTLGYSYSHANNLMYQALYESKIDRVRRGKYQIVNSSELEVA